MGMGNAFMGDAPIMSGHWYNPKSGDSFTVRDTYFEDNNLFVVTTDGRRLDYNMIQSYVQTNSPMPKKPVDNGLSQKVDLKEGLPKEVADLLAEDTALTQTVVSKPATLQAPAPAPAAVSYATNKLPGYAPVEDEDTVMIRRMLSRSAGPEMDIKIKWGKYPVKPMEMLTEYMGVDPEKIADFYISKIDLEEIRKELLKQITDYILGSQIAAEEIVGNTYQAPVEEPKKETAAVIAEQKGEKYYLDENGDVKLTQTGLSSAKPAIKTPAKPAPKKPIAKKAPAKKPVKKPAAKKK